MSARLAHCSMLYVIVILQGNLIPLYEYNEAGSLLWLPFTAGNFIFGSFLAMLGLNMYFIVELDVG